MKKKKSTFEIIRSAVDFIAVAALLVAWGLPDGKLGNIAGWVFLLLGFLPIQSILEPYDKDKSGEYAPAIHLGSLAIVGIFFRDASEPFAWYLLFVFLIVEIYSKQYYVKKCEDYEKQCAYLKERLGEDNNESS